jgi:threonine-phosphate decarboxylase
LRTYEHGGDFDGNAGISLDFSVNLNPFGMPAAVKAAIADGVDSFAAYPDPFCRVLSKEIARFEGVSASAVLCGNGAADLIVRVCLALRAQTTAVFTPTFSEYARCVALAGGRVAEIPLSRERDFAVTGETVRAIPDGADLVFLCNPNNPNGMLVDSEIVELLAVRCASIGAALLIDESFLPFTGGESAIPLMKRYQNLMVLKSFTKLYAMAGVRLGYLVCPDEKKLEQIERSAQVWSVSSVAQTAGVAALSCEPGWTRDTRMLVQKARANMTAGLVDMGLYAYPSDANFLLIESALPLFRALKERGILVRDCSNYRGLDGRFVRFGLKSPAENAALLSAIKEVTTA